MATDQSPQTLEQIWEGARQKALKETNMDIGQRSHKLDKILAKLEENYGSHEERTILKKTQRIIGDVMNFIQLVGGVACQAASMVFSPADMCFNAVSFLIDSVKNIKKMHAALAEMFETIRSFLADFEIWGRIEKLYQAVDLKGLPEEIILDTNKIMCSFVSLCTFTHKAVNRNRFKRVVSDWHAVLTDHGGDLQAELENFKALTSKRSQTATVVTLEEVMESRSNLKDLLKVAAEQSKVSTYISDNVDEINADVRAKNEREKEQEREANLAKRLGINVKDRPRNQPFHTAQERLYGDFEKRLGHHWGVWLDKNTSYASWRDKNRLTDPILFLTGRKGSGKSTLAAKIVRDCMPDPSAKEAAAVAYHFFQDGDESRDAGEEHTFTSALCSMAFMLAKMNPKYAKDLSDLHDWKDYKELVTLSPEQVWTALRFSADRETPFVLVFDGIDQLTDCREYIALIHRMTQSQTHTGGVNSGGEHTILNDAEPPLLTRSTNSALRVLMSVDATNSSMKEFLERFKVQFISLASTDGSEDGFANNEDLEHFIDNRINSDDSQLALVANNPVYKDLFTKFRKHLLRLSQGEYPVIASRIDNVNQQINDGIQRIEELEAVMLSDKRDDQTALAKKALEALEQNLTSHEISQVNDILVWAVWSLGSDLTVAEIDAVDCFNPAPAIIWQPFSAKLKQDKKGYHKLFRFYSDYGQDRIGLNSELEDFLRRMEWSKYGEEGTQVESLPESRISLSINIEAAEPRAVRRFLWDLSEKMEYNVSFFASSDKEVFDGPRIRVDQKDAISRILRQCLGLLSSESEASTQALVRHAIDWLPRYLWKAMQIEATERSTQPLWEFPQKKEILSDLVAFLSKDTFLEHLKLSWPWRASRYWLGDAENTKALNQWLSESNLQLLSRGLQSDLRKIWKSCSGPVGYFRNIIGHIASAWLCESECHVRYIFDWIDAFFTAVSTVPYDHWLLLWKLLL